MDAPTYANVRTDTPRDWMNLQVINVDTGKVLDEQVVEINTEEGWAEVYAPFEGMRLAEIPTRRIIGNFRLEYKTP